MDVIKLNLGCGNTIKDGWINLDQFPGAGVDVVCDVSKEKLPFDDNSFDHILAEMVFEHIYNWESVLLECYRVLKPGGTIKIVVPYCTVGFNSPYHVRYFGKHTMDFMLKNQHHSYGTKEAGASFEMISRKVGRGLPGKWWFKKYLGRWPPAIGLKEDIRWVLMKVQ
jgi:predicted SAM-dependent methyltransferase